MAGRGAPDDDSKIRIAKNQDNLPQKIDLRKFLTSIERQVGNSCVANAMAGAYEYLAKRELGEAKDVSRLFIYYNARYLDDRHDKDAGSRMETAIDGLIEYGACAEDFWPNETDFINEEPAQEAYDHGANFKIVSAEYVETNLDLWREVLADGYPITFAINTFDSFDDASKNKGRVPMPKASDNVRTTHGWHAMLCVGYSDIDKVFIVRNSWGEKWGDGGYCYMPYDYVMHKDYNAHDSWIIKSVENLDYSEDIEVEGDASFFYDEGYLVIEGFYAYCEDSEQFILDLEQLVIEYAAVEDDYFFDYETVEDEDGDEFLQINEFYVNTEDQEGFLAALDELATESAGEEGFDYCILGEEEEEESEEEEEESEEEEEESEEEEDEDSEEEEDEDSEEEEDEDSEEEEDEDSEEEEDEDSEEEDEDIEEEPRTRKKR